MDSKSQKPGTEPAMDDLVVGSWLVQAGVITSDQLMQSIRFSKERNCTLREALIALRLLPSNAAFGAGMMGAMPSGQGMAGGQGMAASPVPPAAESPRKFGGLISSFFTGGSRPSAQTVANDQMPGRMMYNDIHRGGISGAQPLFGGQSGTPMYPSVANQELREVEVRQSLQTSIAEDETPEVTDDLFNKAIDSRATDIHLDPREDDYRGVIVLTASCTTLSRSPMTGPWPLSAELNYWQIWILWNDVPLRMGV